MGKVYLNFQMLFISEYIDKRTHTIGKLSLHLVTLLKQTFSFLSFFKLLSYEFEFLPECTYRHHVYIRCIWKPEGRFRYPGTRIIDCISCSVGARNWSWVLGRSRKCSWLWKFSFISPFDRFLRRPIFWPIRVKVQL